MDELAFQRSGFSASSSQPLRLPLIVLGGQFERSRLPAPGAFALAGGRGDKVVFDVEQQRVQFRCALRGGEVLDGCLAAPDHRGKARPEVLVALAGAPPFCALRMPTMVSDFISSS